VIEMSIASGRSRLLLGPGRLPMIPLPGGGTRHPENTCGGYGPDWPEGRGQPGAGGAAEPEAAATPETVMGIAATRG
jgi:hypothetical protein